MELSTDQILATVVRLSRPLLPDGARHLNIGSGTGALIQLIRKDHPHVETAACDYTDSLLNVPGQKVDIANLNEDALPYPQQSFDLVTCTEVVEHLENYRRLIREMYRVTKPGGSVVISTPNF